MYFVSSIVTLLACLSVHDCFLIQHTEKNVTICPTAKIGCSEQLDYVRWMEVGPPKACLYTPSYIPNWELNCSNVTEKMTHRYSPVDLPPLKIRLSTCPPNNTLVIMYRDPWNRLLSGFGSKFLGICYSNEKCFRQNFIPQFRLDGTNHLHAYLQSVVDSHERGHSLNLHFSPQHKSICLSNSMMQSVAENGCVLRSGDIDSGGLDVVSSTLGHVGRESFTQVMGRGYHVADTCYDIPGHLLARVASFLAGDYRIINALFGKRYDTEMKLKNAVHFKDFSVCHHNHSITVLKQ